MEENPYKSPLTTGAETKIVRPRTPILNALDGAALLIVGGTLINVSYASPAAARLGNGFGMACLVLGTVLLVISVVRWRKAE